MKRLLVLLALVALAAGGGASAAPATRGSLQKPGLLVARERSTVLFGLDGKPLAHLVGLRAPWFADANTARNAAFQQLAAILPDRVLLAGPAGRWYVLDPPGRLDEVASPRVWLPGGAEVVAHTGPKNEGVFQVDVTKLTTKALHDTGLNNRAVFRCRNLFVLGMISWLYQRPIESTVKWLEGRFKKTPDILGANIKALNAIASRRRQTLAQMALAWVLRKGRVTSALIGASRPEQVEDCVGALKALEFSDAELAEIDTYAREADINLWAASAERKGPPRK